VAPLSCLPAWEEELSRTFGILADAADAADDATAEAAAEARRVAACASGGGHSGSNGSRIGCGGGGPSWLRRGGGGGGGGGVPRVRVEVLPPQPRRAAVLASVARDAKTRQSIPPSSSFSSSSLSPGSAASLGRCFGNGSGCAVVLVTYGLLAAMGSGGDDGETAGTPRRRKGATAAGGTGSVGPTVWDVPWDAIVLDEGHKVRAKGLMENRTSLTDVRAAPRPGLHPMF